MSLNDDINDLKDRVGRIENFLLAVFPQAGGNPNPPTSEKSDNQFELKSFNVKKSKCDIGVEYSYRIGIKNMSDHPRKFGGRIIFLDTDEYEVCDDPIYPFTVPGNSMFVSTGKATVMDESHIPRIADVTAEIRPY